MTAVPDPRFRDQLAEFIARHANPFWRAWTDKARAEAIREWQLLLTGEPLQSYLAAEAEARVQAAAEQRAAEELTKAVAKVQAVYDLQCPVRPASDYVDRGAFMAHKWWQTVLGGSLRDLRDRAAALASPAPAPRAEEGPK